MGTEKYILKLSVDKSRSHMPGILPYIPYNEGDGTPQLVLDNTENGNWGGFPCDIEVNGNRLRYGDIIRRYNKIQDILLNSVYGVGVVKSKVLNSKVECVQNCEYTIPERETEPEVVISTYFDAAREKKIDILGEEDNVVDKYDFIPIPLSWFRTDGGGVYHLTEIDERLTEGKYYVLMTDYDTYREYEDLWLDWWADCGQSYSCYFNVPSGEFSFCKVVEKYFIGKIPVPEDITGIRVPQYVYYAGVKELMEWFEEHDLTEEGCLSGKPEALVKRFEENGGLKFYNFLKRKREEIVWAEVLLNGNLAYVPPYLSLSVSLEDCHEYGGMYEPYLFSYSEDSDDFVEAYKGFSGYGGNLTRWIEPEDTYAESMLIKVIDEKATEVDGITGVWGEFVNGSQLFRCTFHTGHTEPSQNVIIAENGYWTCTASNARTIKCGDGEEIDRNTNKYRSVTTLSCIPSVVEYAANGDWYYFMAKKNNGESVHFKIPYTNGTFHNMMETETAGRYIGDYITMLQESGSEIVIQYVIGGTATSSDSGQTFRAVANTGTKYEERYPYTKGAVMVTFMDGFEDVRIVYDCIDMEARKEIVYSTDYNLYRKANRARIIGMEVGTVMNESDMVAAPVFTREATEYLPDETKNTFNVIIDRGNAAAFEKHFKLSECNTFEDLKNYGNNFYNL